MYTFNVAGQEDRCFQVRPPVVAFAGSRHGSLPDSVTVPLAHAFHALDFSLLTGCAPGIDACFRRIMAKEPFAPQSMIACAFESRVHRFERSGLLGIPAITFCQMFFEGLSSVHCCTNIIGLRPLVYELLTNFKRDYKADCKFIEKLLCNSYDVLWDNPKRSPHVRDKHNVKRLHKAFLSVINVESDALTPVG